MTQITVHPLNLKVIPQAGVFVCGNRCRVGKSKVATELVRTLCQRKDGTKTVNRLVLVGRKAIDKAGALLVSSTTKVTLVPEESAQTVLEELMDRQGKKERPKNVVIFLNYMMHRCLEPVYQNLFARATMLNIAVVATVQLHKQLTPEQRRHVDYLFDHYDPFIAHRKHLWQCFFQDWCDTFQDFDKILAKCASQPHEFIVYQKSNCARCYYALPKVTPDDATPGIMSSVQCDQPNQEKLEPFPPFFDFHDIPTAGVIICHSGSGFGKSTLAAQLAHFAWHRDQVKRVVLAGHQAISLSHRDLTQQAVSLPLSKTVLHVELSENDTLLRIMDHQAQSSQPENIVILLDFEAGKNTPTYERLFLEATKLNILLVATSQAMDYLPISMLMSIDLLFTNKSSSATICRFVWDQFYKHSITYDRFDELLGENGPPHFRFLVHTKANVNTLKQYTVVFPQTRQ